MWVSKLALSNIKSFKESGEIELSKKVNVIIGENNSGKSTILNTLFSLQNGVGLPENEIRIGKSGGLTSITLADVHEGYLLKFPTNMIPADATCRVEFRLGSEINGHQNPEFVVNGNRYSFSKIENREPNNFIFLHLSKRKVVDYSPVVTSTAANEVQQNLKQLISKIDRISDQSVPESELFKKACKDIFGFPISAFPSPDGKRAGLTVSYMDRIPFEKMGDGTPNLLGFIVDLCVAKNRLFIIEEMENDIHPKALKGLLALIIEKSSDNQFIISTHSNIVMKFLGSKAETKSFYTSMKLEERLPTSNIKEIISPDERKMALKDLGYELDDFDIWKGWLFLEESSAERIIREYLIKWFSPNLTGIVRTISAGGAGNLKAKFEDFNRLFLYAHLTPIYKNYAWVIVDGDSNGKMIIDDFKKLYSPNGWDEDNFRYFKKDDFEEYYPERFQEKVGLALAIVDSQQKRKAKLELLEDVLNWMECNNDLAKEEWEKSGAEVIEILRFIEKKLS
ncbi:MAG TPA: AAA family ATPase [Candidatus Paceibacterota bacterium]